MARHSPFFSLRFEAMLIELWLQFDLKVSLKSMSKSPHPSLWARDSDEEDRVEAVIRFEQ